MRRPGLLALLLAGVLGAAGCAGGGGEIPGQAEYVRAGDEICREAEARFARESPVLGVSMPAAAAELEASQPILVERVGALEALEPPLELRQRHRELLSLLGDYNAANAAALEAAREGDERAFEEAFAGDPLGNATEIARDLGFEFCPTGPIPEKIDPKLSGYAPDSGIEAPRNSVEEAAADYLEAVGTGDCGRIAAAVHPDNGKLSGPACETELGNQGGVLSATEQFGPAGVATYYFPETGTVVTDAYVQDPSGHLRKAAAVAGYYPLMGLPPDGSNAEEVIAGAVRAVKEDDPDTFNGTLGLDSRPAEEGGFEQTGETIEELGPGGGAVVESMRAEDSELTMIGGDAAFTFALLTGAGRSWVLASQRNPGYPPTYGFMGFWPID